MAVVIVLLLAVGTIFATNMILRASRGALQVEVTQANLGKINDAIVAYVAINGRLPCPAVPSANDGKAYPESAVATCGTANGVIPWKTLGISPDTALDGWNRLVSYRVFDGARGLTQDQGASLVFCDTKVPYGADVLATNGLCQDPVDPLKRNLDTQYLAGKGLTVSNAGNPIKGVAYVLISHGESGYGAYSPGGSREQMPTSAPELANTNAAGTYYQNNHSTPGTDPGSASHFDDILAWTGIQDLAKRSGLTARDWPDPDPPAITAATMSNMNTAGPGHFNATTGSGGTFAATSSTSEGVSTATLAFGAGVSSIYSSCAWWPRSFRLFNSVDRFTLSMYLEFAVADNTRGGTDFGGFLVGFLPYRSSAGVLTVIDNSLCGESAFARNLGWAYDATVVNPSDRGNLPSPRFGVEFDAFPNQGVNYLDPPYNHLAVDFDGTKHDNALAADCLDTVDTYQYDGGNSASPQCYTSSSNAWLRSGLSKFHRMRLEVTPGDSTCPSSSARLKVWVLPESACPDGTSDVTCKAAKAVSQPFVPTLPLASGVVALNRCIPAPIPANVFDQVYFGIMASNRSGTTAAVYFRNLDATASLVSP